MGSECRPRRHSA